MNPALRIGVSGGIGSGKTTVCDMFKELGVPVIDADSISHQVTQKDGPAFQAIVDRLGESIVSESGELQREQLRKLAFADAAVREQLEAIIHPLVREEIAKQIDAVASCYCLISIPLLLESDQAGNFDLILIIDCPEALQISRASRRDNADPVEIKKIIAAQSDRKSRLDKADDVIYNDKDLASLRKQVSSLHRKYTKIARDKQKTGKEIKQ